MRSRYIFFSLKKKEKERKKGGGGRVLDLALSCRPSSLLPVPLLHPPCIGTDKKEGKGTFPKVGLM